MQKWNVKGEFRMALFALRDIQHNEELTYDYNFSLFNPHEGQTCCCGSVNCRLVFLKAIKTDKCDAKTRVGNQRVLFMFSSQ